MAAMIEKFNEAGAKRGGDDSALKRRLVDHLDMLKRPNDLVRITQVTKNTFRVNTLSPHMAEDAVLPTYKIIKSQFLFVEENHGELVITDQTRSRS